MQFIKLTKLDDGLSIWVNPDQIITIISKTAQPGAEITLTYLRVDVKETPADIIALINS